LYATGGLSQKSRYTVTGTSEHSEKVSIFMWVMAITMYDQYAVHFFAEVNVEY
jgi:hypothetical protein